MSLRVVYDTNVLLSAAGWGGTPAACVQLAREGRIRGLTCVEILREFADKLSSKLQFRDEQTDAIMASLLSFLELVPIRGDLIGIQPDPDDDKILECAAVGHATHVVTGDRKHLLPLRRFRETEIVTPAQLLGIVAHESR